MEGNAQLIKLQPLPTSSDQDWSGLHPQRFHLGKKLNIKPKDELNSNYDGAPLEIKGRLHYKEHLSKIHEFKPSLKQFPDLQCKETVQDPKNEGVKLIDFKPSSKKPRPERDHLNEIPSGHQEDLKNGIKPFPQVANATSQKAYYLEQLIQQKGRVRTLDQKRNNLPIASLGDKPYRHPDYSLNYFKEGGLVPGSNIREKPKKTASETILKSVRVAGKLTWKERLKMEDEKQDKDALDELDKWVEVVLKDVNPNYKDPDTFFERMEETQATQAPKKDTKKPAKK